MYIIDIDMFMKVDMAIQIANPAVIGKIEQLAKLTGLNKTAAVEKAVDEMLREQLREAMHAELHRIAETFDTIPGDKPATDPVHWDENGLPT